MTLDPPAPSRTSRRKLAYVFAAICIFLLILGFFYWLFVWRFIEYTNDCYVEGNQIYITPLHSGFITSIHTDDTYLVQKGQLIVELDNTDALIGLDNAEKNLARVVREVSQMFHQVFEYKAEIEVKKAELIKTSQDYTHRKGVIAQEGVSTEDFEHAIAAYRASFFSLEMTKSLYKKALALVQGTTIRNHPIVLAAADRVREAWVYLYRCSIYSPEEGLAAQRTIQVGMWVDSGTPLLSVIPLDQIWVNANFKETQLKHMKIGQKAEIRSDLYGDEVVFHGRITGLPGGAGNAFSLLPPQNLSGNWIKIVQRLPVRIEIDPDELKTYPLRVGLSMEAIVDLKDQEGLLVPVSTRGSPTYKTPIYDDEEIGDQQRIQAVISENMDPSLASYADTPLYLEPPQDSFADGLDLTCLIDLICPLPCR